MDLKQKELKDILLTSLGEFNTMDLDFLDMIEAYRKHIVCMSCIFFIKNDMTCALTRQHKNKKIDSCLSHQLRDDYKVSTKEEEDITEKPLINDANIEEVNEMDYDDEEAKELPEENNYLTFKIEGYKFVVDLKAGTVTHNIAHSNKPKKVSEFVNVVLCNKHTLDTLPDELTKFIIK